MTRTTLNRLANMTCLASLTLALLANAATADAQGREDRWEFTLGAAYQFGSDLDFEGSSTASTDDDFGLTIGGGYNFSDRLAVSFGVQYADISYSANVIEDGGEVTGITGSYESWNTSANLIYSFMDGPITPYVGAGIGWAWIDTNIPNGLPVTGCWWDPWYGYVCYTTYPTKTSSALSYQATLGVRYDFDNDRTFLRLGYTSQWMDFGKATSTPRFDVAVLEVGWIF